MNKALFRAQWARSASDIIDMMWTNRDYDSVRRVERMLATPIAFEELASQCVTLAGIVTSEDSRAAFLLLAEEAQKATHPE